MIDNNFNQFAEISPSEGSFDVTIINIESIYYTGKVTMLTIPGSDGELGILQAHVDLITSLKPGIVKLYHNERVVESFYVSDGYCEVTRDMVKLLVEQIINVKNYNIESLEEEIISLNESLETVKEENKFALNAKLERSKIILQYLQEKPE